MNAHIKVKQMVADKTGTISNKDFFQGNAVKKHLEDIAAASCGRYGKNAKITVEVCCDGKKEAIAYTDGKKIHLNATSPFSKGLSRRENMKLLYGLLSHEMGHILFTDFLASKSWQNYIKKGVWFPKEPVTSTPAEELAKKEIAEYVEKPYLGNAIIKLGHNISNILEDGYIEERMLSAFPGSIGHGLKLARKIHLAEIKPLNEQIEEEKNSADKLGTILQILLSYVKFGEIKYGSTDFSDERIQAIVSLIPDIDAMFNTHVGKARLNCTNMVMIKLWSYIKEMLDSLEEKSKAEETLKELLDALEGMSEETTNGGSAMVDGVPEEKGSSTTSSSKSRKSIAKKMEKAKDGDKSKEESGDKSEKSEKSSAKKEDEKGDKSDKSHSDKSSEEGEEEKDSASSGETEGKEDKDSASSGETEGEGESFDEISKEGEDMDGDKEDNSSETSSKSDSSDKEAKSRNTDRPDVADELEEEVTGEGGVDYDNDYESEIDGDIDREIESLLEKMATESVEKSLESERERALNTFSDGIEYGDIHRGIKKTVFRQAKVSDSLVERYKSVSPELLKISARLAKSVEQELKDAQTGGKRTGLYMGKKTDISAFVRDDGRYFCKNDLPQDFPRLAVGVLLDESGSMSCYNRDVYARSTGLILYDFCRRLGVPCCIYGHSTYYGAGENVALYCYSEFDTIDNNDKYRLMDVHARYNNRDGAAMRFVAERLMTRPEEQKLLIVVSDGAPAANRYGGAPAQMEMSGIVKEYHRKGVRFLAAAIGDDKEAINRIYGDAFLDISDLSMMPKLFTRVIKRYVL